jgi:excisionase family DNA binding protein
MEGDEKIHKAYRKLRDRLDLLDRKLNEKSKPNPLSETWLDTQETCQLLKISKRTLQAYRLNGILPFSTLGGKVYFRASDIEKHLDQHYVKLDGE